jgi:hypothetical protein
MASHQCINIITDCRLLTSDNTGRLALDCHAPEFSSAVLAAWVFLQNISPILAWSP